MKAPIASRFFLLQIAVMSVAFICGTAAAHADLITVKSDATTLAAALGQGSSLPEWWARLDTADVSDLTFVPVDVGGFGSWTPVPAGSPDGTVVVNIPTPGDYSGRSGYFEVTFSLPSGFSDAQLAGQANVDDCGRVFLNGNPISAPLGGSGGVSEFGDTLFTTSDPALFQPGVNTLLISDSDIQGGGPSGAAFYANITYTPAPEPASLSIVALGIIGMLARRRGRIQQGE